MNAPDATWSPDEATLVVMWQGGTAEESSAVVRAVADTCRARATVLAKREPQLGDALRGFADALTESLE